MKAQKAFANRLMAALDRGSIGKCSEWTVKYRVMGKPYPGPWSFKHHPWLVDMHDDPVEMMSGQKAAQMGFTEYLLNWSLYNIDIQRESVLYVLPTDVNAGEFSVTRFDSALDCSPYLQQLFSDVSNNRVKRAGTAVLYVRGSRARNQLISIPVSRIALDELEEMVQDNVHAIPERMSGQTSKQIRAISTPLIEGTGINKMYMDGDQRIYFFRCPACNRYINLEFPRNISIETDNYLDSKGLANSYYFCHECKAVLKHETKDDWMTYEKGLWVPTYADREAHSYHINQMYSRTVKPSELGKHSLESQTNPAKEQELYNQKLGLPRVVKGGRIEEEHFVKATGRHMMAQSNFSSRNIVTIGVDVGKVLHYEIAEWIFKTDFTGDVADSYLPKIIKVGTVESFDMIDHMFANFGIVSGVIDRFPETRLSTSLCRRLGRSMAMCQYGNEVYGKDMTLSKDLDGTVTITVNRTAWLDQSLGRYLRGPNISLPLDIPLEYKTHLMNTARVYKTDADGNVTVQYVNGQRPDHFAHARNYNEMALKLFLMNGVSMDI